MALICDAPADHDSDWFALEAAIAISTPITYSEGQQVYGGCLEPGYQLQTERWLIECPGCGRHRCTVTYREKCEGGSLNYYQDEECDACDYCSFETD